ncbi:TraB/GumN family protein [Shouchella sp. JSM 1781072]|uniref:TraB/GumN family protein n=1 Tax=Shouchella sp. JSM 1781072 TaxID=3344581 RepID=UPI0035BEC282
MNKKFGLVAIAAVTILAACNDANQENEGEETVEIEEGNGGFLWKVEQGDTEVYLQGTIHVGREDFYPLNPQTEAAYDAADVVLPEVDLIHADLNELEMMMTERALLADDTTLDELISDEAYEQLEAILTDNGVPIELFQGFEPWFVENMLLAFSIGESNVEESAGVEEYFLNRAVEDEKEIRELESIEAQFEVLSGFSMETQIQMLEGTLETFDEADEELEAMADMWVEGDTEGLESLWDELEESEVDNEYAYELNESRNYDMAQTIDEILQEDSGQTYFVIVGSMHLVAEPSIVSILEDEGYTVDFIY